MTALPSGPDAAKMEVFLSGAYRRILRATMVLSAVGTAAALLFFDWRSGLGLALGSLLAQFNFVWLRHGTEIMVGRMINQTGAGPSRFRLMIAFVGRYLFVTGIAYVILKGYRSLLVGFIVGLACPILAAMCEGVYEAVAGNTN